MTLSQRISKWFRRYQNTIFIYKDGFFDLPYLSNSPETIVKSIAKIPIFKHSVRQQSVTSNTPLIKGVMYYEEIEKGFWLIHGDVKYKANINYRKTTDKKMESEYFFLNLTISGLNYKSPVIDGVVNTNGSWMLYKPDSWTSNYHFKGAEEQSFTLYFNSDWIKRVLYTSDQFLKSQVKLFFEKEAKFIIFQHDESRNDVTCSQIHSNFKDTQRRTKKEKNELKELAYQLVFKFIETYNINEFSSNLFEIPDKDRKLMAMTEKILLENLMQTFPGIELIARKVGVSETKLKSNFKAAFGKTLFQFFQEKQMNLAKDLLCKEPLKVKDLASSMGYENASKFAAAFKKQTGRLPSEIESAE